MDSFIQNDLKQVDNSIMDITIDSKSRPIGGNQFQL